MFWKNALIGFGILLFGFMLFVVSGWFMVDYENDWKGTFFGILFVVGLVIMVAGPLIWWLILPLVNLIGRKRDNAK